MEKKNVQLAQVNYTYGGFAWLPYSAGIIQANAIAQPDLKEAYNFSTPVFLREDPVEVVNRMDNLDVLGLSCYIWNWEWDKAVARKTKEKYPDSLVVMGGPQVPNRPEGFFVEHPYVDILVRGEGEKIFQNVLRERLKETPDYSQVDGITFNRNGISISTTSRPRLSKEEVVEARSPYLDGTFEELMAQHQEFGYNFTSETHRGCPFSCKFCVWGSEILQLSKVHLFPDDRVKAEYDYFARHGADFVYNADANFALFPRDEPLTDHVIELNRKTGFPRRIRANWAKNKHDRIFNIAKKLNKAQMDTGITLSLQSLHKPTLEAIKRINIKFDNFTELVNRYDQEGIPTYTELIIPLPLETYESFTDGLETLLTGGQHTGISIYQCMLLNNSEMDEPGYIKDFELKSIDSVILQNHSTPGTDPVKERTKYVVSTSTMPLEDVKIASLYAWAIQGFHSLGLTQDIAIHLKSQGIPYWGFYEGLIASDRETIVGKEVESTKKHLEDFLEGRGGDLGAINPRYGNIIWPLEELSFLNIVTENLDGFYSEVKEMVEKRFGYTIPESVMQRQKERLVTPKDYDNNLEEYVKEAVWYGRKRGKTLKSTTKQIEEAA